MVTEFEVGKPRVMLKDIRLYTGIWEHYQSYIKKRSCCIPVYGSTTNGDVVKRSDLLTV